MAFNLIAQFAILHLGFYLTKLCNLTNLLLLDPYNTLSYEIRSLRDKRNYGSHQFPVRCSRAGTSAFLLRALTIALRAQLAPMESKIKLAEHTHVRARIPREIAEPSASDSILPIISSEPSYLPLLVRSAMRERNGIWVDRSRAARSGSN